MSISPDSAHAQDTLSLTTYNLLNYTTTDVSRDHYFRTVLRHANSDILVVQEMTSQAAFNNFYYSVVDMASPGEFSAGTFLDGPDSDNALFFRTAKFDFISNTPIRTALRDISEFTLVHHASAETLRIYCVHLKASSGSVNELLRAAEIDSLRKVTNALPDGKYFIVCGDFNIYGSSEPAYQKLLQEDPNNDGHFIDADSITGTWNNSAYAQHHTQSTRVRQFGGGASGGLDDRFDMILFSRAIAPNSGGRITYLTNSMSAMGNDRLHYNDSINRLPNTAVPDSVAIALHYASDHLPVTARLVFQTTIVPIQLAYFNAHPVPGLPSSVLLAWCTISETNNYGFFVYRRFVADSTWCERPNSFVPGHGTTLEPQHYTFTDTTAPAGVLQYRLKQIDLDGTAHFTDPVSVTIIASVQESTPHEFELLQSYPNPFNRLTSIRYTVPVGNWNVGFVCLRIYDLLGCEVATLVNEVKPAGKYEVTWDAAGLASGVYVCRMVTAQTIQTRKLLMLR